MSRTRALARPLLWLAAAAATVGACEREYPHPADAGADAAARAAPAAPGAAIADTAVENRDALSTPSRRPLPPARP